MKINLKQNLNFIILVGLLLLVSIFIINRFSYFNPLSMCYIKIEGNIVSGNEETIQKAIRKIKKTDKTAYKNLCKYVDKISEKNCVIADWHIARDEFDTGWRLPGCYVKGTKTIYLLPEKKDSTEIVEKRAEKIKEISEFSKDYLEKNR